MNELDKQILRQLNLTTWTQWRKGTREIPKGFVPALKRLMLSGYIIVRTINVSPWGGAEQVRMFYAERGVKTYAELSQEDRVEYGQRFHSGAFYEAKLLPQGADVQRVLN